MVEIPATQTSETHGISFDGGARRTGRRPIYHLVPKELLEAVADTRVEGDCKYEPGNWKQGEREFFVDCLSHAIDHLMDCVWDEKESMCVHLGHAATNISFILWAMRQGKVTREDFRNAARIVGSERQTSGRERYKVKHLRDFALFFSAQCLLYGLVTWNFRVIAQARFGSIFASDICIAAVNFSLIKKVAEAKSKAAWIGYVLGGACGSVLSAWITKHVYGQQAMIGGKWLAKDLGAFDPPPAPEAPEPEPVTPPATASIWESARMDDPTAKWLISRWRQYGDGE